MSIERINYLLEKYLDGKATGEERNELANIVLQEENASIVTASLEQLIEKTGKYPEWKGERMDEMVKGVLEVEGVASADLTLNPSPEERDFEDSKIRRMFPWRRIASVASVILILGGVYFLFVNKEVPRSARDDKKVAVIKDIEAPKGTKAMITLVDGRKVALDSLVSGTLATQGDVKVVKNANGEIVYQSAVGSQQSAVEYNTLYNPRGSKVVSITLVDGTKAWLNADASLKYFTNNEGKERNVEITGEAYFEVAHNQAKPFIVTKGEVQVQVLGTHFDMNAYDDESDIKVTLLEGSVKVLRSAGSSVAAQVPRFARDDKGVVIKPGQQAIVRKGGDDKEIKVVAGVDIDEVMAWKNGTFSFNKTDLKSIMRQVMRWYDVDVVYEGNVADRYFTADISRDKNLSAMLKILELSKIHFRIEGRG